MSKSQIEAAQRSSLPKLIDVDDNNNYGEWETKCFHLLQSWDLWKYIDGDEDTPPIIPTLRADATYHGTNDEGEISVAHIPSNAVERDAAIAAAKPWKDNNDLCLTKLVNAVPGNQIHLVKRVPYAKTAWDNLRSIYQPMNSLRATALKSDILTYRCQANMNVSLWLTDMQSIYNNLSSTDPDSMDDRSFTFAILDNMPEQDGAWRDFLSNMRTKIRDKESHTPRLPVLSKEFISLIREEYWYRHKNDAQANTHVFSARIDADKRASKRPRPAASSSDSPSTSKRVRKDKHCSNSHCGSPKGHEFEECMAYGGGSQGKYTGWWKGPWNIHLPLDQRSKANNVPPESHPLYAKHKTSAPKASAVTYSHNTTRSAVIEEISSTDDEPLISLALTNESPYPLHVGNELIIASLPLLEEDLPQNDNCYHDSAANRHVFHDRSAFDRYQSIDPLSVKGFGRDLSTVAIGRGNVRLRCTYNDRVTKTIVLTDVLHIPAARSNLVSNVRLDKMGVFATLGDGGITLLFQGSPLVSGSLHHEMYRLNFSIIRPPSPRVHTLSANTLDANFYTA